MDWEQVLDRLMVEAAEVEGDARLAAVEVRVYAKGRALHLASIVGEPGYAEAVAAEADSITLKAAAVAADQALAANKRWIGIIQGLLMALVQGL